MFCSFHYHSSPLNALSSTDGSSADNSSCFWDWISAARWPLLASHPDIRPCAAVCQVSLSGSPCFNWWNDIHDWTQLVSNQHLQQETHQNWLIPAYIVNGDSGHASWGFAYLRLSNLWLSRASCPSIDISCILSFCVRFHGCSRWLADLFDHFVRRDTSQPKRASFLGALHHFCFSVSIKYWLRTNIHTEFGEKFWLHLLMNTVS